MCVCKYVRALCMLCMSFVINTWYVCMYMLYVWYACMLGVYVRIYVGYVTDVGCVMSLCVDGTYVRMLCML